MRRTPLTFSRLSITASRYASLGTALLLMCFICLAFGIRLYHLDAQSLWSDEGLTVYRARQGIAANLRNEIIIENVATTDTNPSLYFLLLSGFRAVAGESEFALRFFSVWWGTLIVPLLFAAGHRLFNSDLGGLIAAILGAFSPFYVWHSQELRMYPMTVALAILSAFSLTRLVWPEKGRSRTKADYVTYGLTTVALVYTHYSGFYLLAFEGIILVGAALIRRHWRMILGLALTALAAFPLIVYAIQRLGTGKEPYYGDFTFGQLVHDLVSTFSLGWTFPPRRPAEQLVVPLGLLVLGLLLLTRQRRIRVALFLAGWLIIPVVTLYAVSQIKSTYLGPRHLLIISPAFYLAQAGGVVGLRYRWRPVGLTMLTVILIGMAVGLRIQFTDPVFLKDDLRSAARYISERARPDDIVVVHDAIIKHTFDYYYTGKAPRVVIPPFPPQGEDDAVARFRQAAETHDRVWFLFGPPPLSGFPSQVLPDWADTQLFKLDHQLFEGLTFYVGVSAYTDGPPLVGRLPADAEASELSWGSLRLVGFRTHPVAAGENEWLEFYWQVKGDLPGEPLTLIVKLRDEKGIVWLERTEQVLPFYPPTQWPVDRLVQTELRLPLASDMPPVTFTVEVEPVSLGQPKPVGQLTVSRPTTRAPAPRPQARFEDGIELLASELTSNRFRAGFPLLGSLTWRAATTPVTDYHLRVRLTDLSGHEVAVSEMAPSAAGFPTSAWRPDDRVAGRLALPLPADLDSGTYRVQISLLSAADGRVAPVRYWYGKRDWLNIGTVQVEAWPLVTKLPAGVAHRLEGVRIGEVIQLRGYDLVREEDKLTLTLYWQADQSPAVNYHVFVHLGVPDLPPIAQADGVPGAWLRPTTTWRPDEVIADTYVVSLAGVPPGRHDLLVGLYDPANAGQRPMTAVNGKVNPDGYVLLQAVEVRD